MGSPTLYVALVVGGTVLFTGLPLLIGILKHASWRAASLPGTSARTLFEPDAPESVAYLSRYTHRVAISNRRLLAFDETGVAFRYKDYRREWRGPPAGHDARRRQFIRRFLLHVLPRGFHRIRHYGLLASSARKVNLARARELLVVAPPPDDDVPEEPLDVRPPCPCCGGHMIIIETFERWRQPRAPPRRTPPTGRNSP